MGIYFLERAFSCCFVTGQTGDVGAGGFFGLALVDEAGLALSIRGFDIKENCREKLNTVIEKTSENLILCMTEIQLGENCKHCDRGPS